MKHPKAETDKRIASLIREVPRRGLERHASIVQDMDEVPKELRSDTLFQRIKNEKIDRIIVFPPQIQRGWNYIPKQASIFTGTGVIHSMASLWPDAEPDVTCIRGCDVVYMEITLILLYGRLLIVADDQGVSSRIEVEFNTVAWDQFSKPLYRFFHTEENKLGPSKIAASHENVDLNTANLPIKFSNGIRLYGLLKNEELQGCIFQPEQWRRWLVFLRKQLLANTMILLTGNYGVVMREELHVRQGWILTYIPRKNIHEITQQSNGSCQEVNLHMKHQDVCATTTITVSSEAADRWRQAWGQSVTNWRIVAAEAVGP